MKIRITTLLFIALLFLLQISCSRISKDSELSINIPSVTSLDKTESEWPSEKPSQRPSIEPLQDLGDKVVVYLPALNKDVNYLAWEKYFNSKYNLNVSVNAYTSRDGDLESNHIIYSEPTGFNASAEDIERNGVYLYNAWTYYSNYQMRLNYIQNHPDYEYKNQLMGSLGQPFNALEVTGVLAPELLAPFTDNNGNIWALPYEYKYPEVKVRKYNKEILNDLGKDVPDTIEDLYDLLVSVKRDSDIPAILPRMKMGDVFSGFEDIVNAFGIRTSTDTDSFYSIQFDDEEGKFVDVALKEKMKQCIDFFTLLIDEEIILLTEGEQSSNDSFYDNLVFSVYENIDREEDLFIPYTQKIFALEYEPKLYFSPSRYVYILGRDLEMDPIVDDFLKALYVNVDSSISARFGREGIEYSIRDSKIYISHENYKRSPKLIGEFPEDLHQPAANDDLRKHMLQITNENIKSGYYEAITPYEGALETWFDISLVEGTQETFSKRKHFMFAQKFYAMLSDHFFDNNRPSTDEFITNYKDEMRKLAEGEIVQKYFYQGMWLEVDIEY